MRLSVSQGTNLSHHTPNTSLGLVQATPSRVLPSPTVNTQEALSEFSPLPTLAPPPPGKRGPTQSLAYSLPLPSAP